MGDKRQLELILSGEYVLPDFYQTLGEAILRIPIVQQRIMTSKSELQNLNIYWDNFPHQKFRQLVDKASKALQKSNIQTNLFLEYGNAFLEDSDLTKSILCYNIGSSFAPPNSKYFGQLLTERAAVLLLMGKIDESLADIETALNHHLTPELQDYMTNIKNAYLSLNSKDTCQGDDTAKQEIKDYCDNVVFTLAGNPNPKLQSGSEFIEIVFDPKIGRRVIATKALEPGVTIMVENPYILHLSNICTWDFQHCYVCLKKISSTLACPGCVFMSYCSETCRDSDFQNGHEFECPCMPFVHGLRLAPFIHMSFKIICKAGPEVLYKSYKRIKAVTKFETCTLKGFDPVTGVYRSDSYHQMENLIYHNYHDSVVPSMTLPWISLNLVHALDYKTGFFSAVDPADKPRFLFFVASKLLFHCNSAPFNSIGLYEDTDQVKSRVDTKSVNAHRVEIAGGVYPLMSILNHSCDPNVSRSNLPNGRMSIITNRSLKAGDELVMSYGQTFMSQEREHRRSQLKKSHRFKCKCRGCQFYWPLFKSMKPMKFPGVEFLCPCCSGSPSFDYSKTDKALKFVLLQSKMGGSCRNCKQDFQIGTFKAEVRVIQAKMSKAKDLINNGMFVEAVPLLVESISYFQTKTLFPNMSILAAQEALRNCYRSIARISYNIN